jgi:hypothetical protein
VSNVKNVFGTTPRRRKAPRRIPAHLLLPGEGRGQPVVTTSVPTKPVALDPPVVADLSSDDGVDIPWSPSWVAAQMTATYSFKRVPKEDGVDCCNGLACYHYQTTLNKKVTGDGAAAPTGKVTGLTDGSIVGTRSSAGRTAMLRVAR